VNNNETQFKTADLEVIKNFFHELILKRNEFNKNFLNYENKKLPEITNSVWDKEEWYAVPGMYGGFAYKLVERDKKPLLISSSWCRVVGGSGQKHEITIDGCILVEEGFV